MRRSRPSASHDRWLVSYADFITLLFAFFVVLYASAEVDRHRMNQLSVAIKAGFQEMGVFNSNSDESLAVASNTRVNGSAFVADNVAIVNLSKTLPHDNDRESIERLRLKLESELQERHIPPAFVSVRATADGVAVSLREIGFFDSGSAHMRPQAQPLFTNIVALVAEQHCPLRIEGHTDNVPIHNAVFNSNWELSTARGTEVIRLLVTKYGFDPQDMSAAGYAEFHPIAANDTAEGRSVNRRIDIVLLTGARHSSYLSAR